MLNAVRALVGWAILVRLAAGMGVAWGRTLVHLHLGYILL
jgi:hypothetical protein